MLELMLFVICFHEQEIIPGNVVNITNYDRQQPTTKTTACRY